MPVRCVLVAAVHAQIQPASTVIVGITYLETVAFSVASLTAIFVPIYHALHALMDIIY
jgi:hypothetical protein